MTHYIDELEKIALSLGPPPQPPVIFCHWAWDGQPPYTLNSGDVLIGDDTVEALREKYLANGAVFNLACAPEFCGIEIVRLSDALNNPDHRFYARANAAFSAGRSPQ